MFTIPEHINHYFCDLLIQEAVPKPEQGYYKKWLRYYWDFCHKYEHSPDNKNSLPLFLQKLREKRQSEQQCQQAQQAIQLFYRMKLVNHANIRTETPQNSDHTDTKTAYPLPRSDSNHSSTSIRNHSPAAYPIAEPPHHNHTDNRKNNAPSYQQTGQSWVFVFNQLQTEIKLRHYSPKTLKAYQSWIRHFQAFTKSKAYQQLTQKDVVDFLSYLAVEKKVSASSQNQAFNALLFLFRNVLKKSLVKSKVLPGQKEQPIFQWCYRVKKLISF
ncbi:site-specific integrase [Methyloprofundus sedimenti]|uniref:site-specific integrase n=1 Tax=Methyloprofundus sedimenti TaxID=1420851 RepID=UPI00117E0D83|nr:site-specific integrase [Methyloprofundus sedimenti]